MSIMDEFAGITEAKSALPGVLTRLESGSVDHVFVMRNNKPAAVLSAVDEYQHLRSLSALREHLEDAQMIHEAIRADDGVRHNLDDALADSQERT